MRRLTLTAEDMRDLIAGSTINAKVEDGEELITSGDVPSGWAGAVLSAVSEWDDGEFHSAFGFTRQEADA